MNTRRFTSITIAGVTMACGFQQGCGEARMSPWDEAAAASVHSEQWSKELESMAPLILPDRAVVLFHDDGEGVETKLGLKRWTIFSVDEMKLPHEAPAVTMEMDKKAAERTMRVGIRKQPLSGVTSASICNWNNGNYEFRGILVRASEGWFLQVERFRRQEVR